MLVHIAKLNETLDVEITDERSIKYVFEYGAKQCLNDAAASVQRKDFDFDAEFRTAVMAKVQKRIDQLESGNVPGSRGAADPRAAKIRKLTKLAESNAEAKKLLDQMDALLAA